MTTRGVARSRATSSPSGSGYSALASAQPPQFPAANVDHAGSVRFERTPEGQGTFVRVTMEYRPPGGVFGASIAKLLGEEPDTQVQRDLYRFKQIVEAGELVTHG